MNLVSSDWMELFDLWNLFVNSFCKVNFNSAKTNTDLESFSKEVSFLICSPKILQNVRRGRQFFKLKRKCTFVFKPRRCVPFCSCRTNYRGSWQIRTSKDYFTHQLFWVGNINSVMIVVKFFYAQIILQG